ncbi:MAG: restriction endonuclease subunit S [Ferruginibacter sp.]
MKLSDLFIVKNGLSSGAVKIAETKSEEFNTPYLRPSSNYYNLIAGYVDKKEVNDNHIFPPETIFVSSDGQGSHSYAYVSPVEFVPNSNVSVLIPKTKMSLKEKIFYAMIITKNRYRFSYGRKPKGKRFSGISIPSKHEIPKWVSNFNTDKVNFSEPLGNKKIDLNKSDWDWFKYEDIFDIKKGKRLTKANMIEGTTPFIGAIDANNGYREYIGQPANHLGNTITVNYNGSVGEAFYQPDPFWASDDVNVLYPKFELDKYIAFFLISLIRKEKFRFNYGRKWEMAKMNRSMIMLPIDKKGNPDWQLMKSYIKSLPYSASI